MSSLVRSRVHGTPPLWATMPLFAFSSWVVPGLSCCSRLSALLLFFGVFALAFEQFRLVLVLFALRVGACARFSARAPAAFPASPFPSLGLFPAFLRFSSFSVGFWSCFWPFWPFSVFGPLGLVRSFPGDRSFQPGFGLGRPFPF